MEDATEPNAASEWREIDISSEAYRIYHYSFGITEGIFRISRPLRLFVKSDERGDTHRVTAQDGLTYRPERGWVGISWSPNEGAEAFVA